MQTLPSKMLRLMPSERVGCMIGNGCGGSANDLQPSMITANPISLRNTLLPAYSLSCNPAILYVVISLARSLTTRLESHPSFVRVPQSEAVNQTLEGLLGLEAVDLIFELIAHRTTLRKISAPSKSAQSKLD